MPKTFKDLNKNSYKMTLAKYMKQNENCSKLHKIARELLYKEFGGFQILEEVKIKTKPFTRSDLFLDFLILSFDRAYEIQGKQHFEYNDHFYNSKRDFIEQKKRDRYKREWCEINEITLIELGYDHIDDWERKIRED